MAPVKILSFDAEKATQNILCMTWDATIACFKFICSFSDEKLFKLTRYSILSFIAILLGKGRMLGKVSWGHKVAYTFNFS